MMRCGYVPLIGFHRWRHFGTKVADNAIPVKLSIKTVNLGQFRLQFIEITLRQAAHDENAAYAPLALGLGQFKDGVDRFLLGIAYETAGVHYHHRAAHVVAVVHYFIASCRQTA